MYMIHYIYMILYVMHSIFIAGHALKIHPNTHSVQIIPNGSSIIGTTWSSWKTSYSTNRIIIKFLHDHIRMITEKTTTRSMMMIIWNILNDKNHHPLRLWILNHNSWQFSQQRIIIPFGHGRKKTGALGAHATPVAPQRPLLAHRVGLAEGAWGNMVMLADGLWWFMGIRIMLGSD